VALPLTGAVALVQRFGSALQLTPHFHLLLPEAAFEELRSARDSTGVPSAASPMN